MSEIKNSAFLDQIIREVRAQGDGETPLVAQRLLLRVLEYLDRPEAELSGAQQQELLPLRLYLRANELDTAVMAEKLRNLPEMSPIRAYTEINYIQQKLMQGRAEVPDGEELTVDRLLVSILRDPNDTVRACLNEGAEAPRGEAQKEEPQDERLQGLLAALRASRTAGSQGGRPEEETAAEDQMLERFERELARQGRAEAASTGGETPESDAAPKDRVTTLVDVVKQTRAALLERIFGQDNAVNVFTNGYFQGELQALVDKGRRRPRASFLFAGPPGVGKTFLAETAAEVLGLPFKRFDMSEYSDKEAVVMLCGADSVYRDSQEGVLSGFVAKNPKCILLFDEIEKAHINAIHLFLQILDAGRLSDAKTRREVSFADTIVIFTTNAGRNLYADSESGDLSTLSRKVILKALETDVDPASKTPYFPAAMCSRFASGNVVMFNHMSAHDLRDIAKNVILRQTENLYRAVGIRSLVDEKVFTALLLAEGGAADARMIRGRAQSFYSQELFELFRLVDSEKTRTGIGEIEEIGFTVQLPEQEPAIQGLFEVPREFEVLVFASPEAVDWCADNSSGCAMLGVQDLSDAETLLRERELRFALLDMRYGRDDTAGDYLNVEDIDSSARDLLWLLREKYSQLPVYLLVGPGAAFDLEEELSFRKIGVQGFLEAGGEGEAFRTRLAAICERLVQQQNVVDLGRANKLLSFETAQRISPDGKRAEIRLFDFELATAVEAEDARNVLSSVSRPEVPFSAVIGAEDAKQELRDFVDYLRQPKKYAGRGLSAPKGVLLYGPPGTGKTMLAKAMACESGVTFLAAEGNQFLKRYVGEGPESVHELFRTARKYAPSILFVDEIDAIAKARTGSEQSEAREEILTAFLTEMDGFRPDPKKPVFVLAATNFDVEPGKKTGLDPALLRRFDRRIYVDLPNKAERLQYLQTQVENKALFALSGEILDNIALRSAGMSLASLASVLELAKRMAFRTAELKVTDPVLEEAFESFNGGEEKTWDSAELERTARHEAGHALLSWLSGDKPSYLTIVARGNHGGYMQHGDNEQKGQYTRDELLARIRTALGGRAAELVYYGEREGLSTGASGDLAAATNLARSILACYGMDEDFGLAVLSGEELYSPELRAAVNRLLAEQMRLAAAEIQTRRPAIDALVEALKQHNRLSGAEIDRILSEQAAQA